MILLIHSVAFRYFKTYFQMLLQMRGKGIRKVALWGAEKMAPSVRCLLHKPEHLSLNLQHPHEKLGMCSMSLTFVPGAMETGGCLKLTDQPA